MCGMSTQEIRGINNFPEFLEKCIGRSISEYKLKALTKPGDNYGSVVCAVEVKGAGTPENNEGNILHLVAKTALTNEYLIKIFRPDVTFVKEAHFYSDIIPAIERFEESAKLPHSERIQAFIRCVGSRLSLDSNAETADSDAVILLENVKLLNFKNIDQRIGFDSHECSAIIKQLAKFHSLCIAMRLQQPELFDLNIRPFTNCVKVILNNSDAAMDENICSGLRCIEDFETTFRNRIENHLKRCYVRMKEAKSLVVDTPYDTVVHRDFWSTNIMIRSGERIEIKIYDFQMYRFDSFAFDLILFLTTSVRSEDLRRNFKSNVAHYHSEFRKMLDLLDCPLDDYTFEKMWHEIGRKANEMLLFVLHIVKIIYSRDADLHPGDRDPREIFLRTDQPSEGTLKRWKLIIELFDEHGFI